MVASIGTPTAPGSAVSQAGPDFARVSALVQSHLPFVTHVARKLAKRLPSHVSTEDLRSAGLTGLLQAARRFEPDRDTSFAHFAYARIRGAMLDELRSLDWGPRRNRREATDPSMTAFSSLFQDEEPPFVFRGHDPSTEVEARDWREFALRQLTGRERLVVSLYYLGGLTGAAIGRALNLSESRITRIRQEAIRRLRRQLRQGRAA